MQVNRTPFRFNRCHRTYELATRDVQHERDRSSISSVLLKTRTPVGFSHPGWKLRMRSGYGRVPIWMHCHAARRPVLLPRAGPLVSFAFDDFPRTAYAVGGSILRNLGIRGTFYVAMGLMNGTNSLGDQFHLEDLYSAAADGHELATHTFHHTSSRTAALEVFLEDVREGYKAMSEIPDLPVSANFAYPNGHVTLAAKRAVGREMLSCRGVYGGLNGSVVDLNLLRANSLYGGMDSLGEVRSLLRDNERRNGWLIFYTHDVRRTPSAYGCTPELLESVVRQAIERSMKILPVGEVLARAVKETAEGMTRHTGYASERSMTA